MSLSVNHRPPRSPDIKIELFFNGFGPIVLSAILLAMATKFSCHRSRNFSRWPNPLDCLKNCQNQLFLSCRAWQEDIGLGHLFGPLPDFFFGPPPLPSILLFFLSFFFLFLLMQYCLKKREHIVDIPDV
jgi:hypothetical protein